MLEFHPVAGNTKQKSHQWPKRLGETEITEKETTHVCTGSKSFQLWSLMLIHLSALFHMAIFQHTASCVRPEGTGPNEVRLQQQWSVTLTRKTHFCVNLNLKGNIHRWCINLWLPTVHSALCTLHPNKAAWFHTLVGTHSLCSLDYVLKPWQFSNSCASWRRTCLPMSSKRHNLGCIKIVQGFSWARLPGKSGSMTL